MSSTSRGITCFTRCARICCDELGRDADAAAAYQAAIALCENAREKGFLAASVRCHGQELTR